jgi:hypothetical protein
MGLLDAILQDSATFNVWIAARTDGIAGSGTASDPFNGATRQDPALRISLSYLNDSPQEARVNTAPVAHGFTNGDVVTISGVIGTLATFWNGTFGIYGVTEFGFNYCLKKRLPPSQPVPGSPTCIRLTFPFDEVMRQLPTNILIRVGPGIYQTRGFAPNDSRGWQPKSGQKIVGAGINVTTLQLVGAENTDQHYHAIGMPIEPSGLTPIVALESFEVSDLTIDCNLDNQPSRPDPGYPLVACGAIRIFGHHSRVSRVHAVNWGTKSLKQGCFVISIIQASGQPTGVYGNPSVTERDHCGIEDCIAVQPSQSCARETTVLHIGGLKNATNHAQGFARAPFIRRNFVDCQFRSTPNPNAQPPIPSIPYSSAFITSKEGTDASAGKFIGKRLHSRNDLDAGTFLRLAVGTVTSPSRMSRRRRTLCSST